MAPNAAKSILFAENRTLAGENESQDSQDLLMKHMLKHGLGVYTSTPPSSVEHQSKRTPAVSSIKPTKVDIPLLVEGLEEEWPNLDKQPRNASNALSAENLPSKQSSKLPPNPLETPEVVQIVEVPLVTVPVQPILNNAISALEGPSRLTNNAALSALPSSNKLKKTTGEMSSDSPTQSNDGRSYEQYADDNSQLQSSQASGIHEHRTLQENDTGFLNFKRPSFDIPESAPEDVEVNHANDPSGRSQPISQAPGTDTHARLFQNGGNGAPLMAASQLFASPTSSRPSPYALNHNIISPNPLASSPLKNRGLMTSPTNAYTSSPAFPGVSSRPSSRPLGKETSSAPMNSREDEGHNKGNAPRRKPFLEPIGEYKSLRRQSLEADDTKSPTHTEAAAYRRRLARLKQEKASKSFPYIILPRSSSNKGDNVEVPSTSRTKSVNNGRRAESERYLAQCHGKTTTDNDGSQETVADSQEVPAQAQHTETNFKASDESNERKTDNTEEAHNAHLPRSPAPTSPPGTSIQPPKLLGDIMGQYSTISSGTGPGQELKQSNDPKSSSLPEQQSSIPTNRKHQSSRASSPQPATRRSARLGNIVTPSSTGHNSPLPSDSGTRTSALSSLSATPNMSSSATPSTDPDNVSVISRRRSSSPAVKKIQRPSSSLPQIKTNSRSRETDELANSPLARQSIANQNLRRMVFALSIQTAVERIIRQEGGKILSGATSNTSAAHTLSSSLTLFDQDTGFTALIADRDSRKAKYMQALALGIPCLAPKWILDCKSKKEIVDWTSYLLCAGPSALLGGAVRSRNLQPYDASLAKLEDVINNRPKLLDNARKRLPYVFLAQVLGGSLLRDEESQDQPFDWNALFGSSTGNGVSNPKKRKRQSIGTGTTESDRPPKRIRTLSDELVIQSLILGRLIEDGEMEE
ncbi:hypothetical protein F4804DRAFT_345398 [Jackrogersella minutella]|nr:hypothetical protein F4804DRAFT_345398 [Jackrogersella minutella]